MKVDQLRGEWLQFRGEVQKQWGTLIDDDLRQIEGNYEKVLGMLQQRYGGNCVRLVRERTAGKSTNSYNGLADGYNDLSGKSRKRRRV